MAVDLLFRVLKGQSVFLPPKTSDCLTQPSILYAPQSHYLKSQRPQPAVSHAPPSGTLPKNLWSYASFSQYILKALSLIKHRGNFSSLRKSCVIHCIFQHFFTLYDTPAKVGSIEVYNWVPYQQFKRCAYVPFIIRAQRHVVTIMGIRVCFVLQHAIFLATIFTTHHLVALTAFKNWGL